ncbi:MAG: hypothetical protein ACI8U4_001048 [Natronomonas sp.]|jgi:hypothetical protein
MSTERGSTDRGFGSLLFSRSSLLDAALILAVPVVLIAVFSLPAAVREAYVLAYTAPTLTTMFTSHFVHQAQSHLAANLFGYAFVVPLTYLLCVLSGRRQLFRVVFVSLLVSLPVALSALNLLFIRPRVGYGFSGVVMGYFGFLPLALFGYFERQVALDIERHHSPVLFFLGIATISVAVTSTTAAGVLIAGASLVICGVYAKRLFGSVDLLGYLSSGLRETTPGYAELGAVGVVVFLTYPFVAFPSNPIGDGTVVNLYTHLLGFALGFISTYSLRLMTGFGFDET